ncbi:hypothetical protein ASPWEDRAFT_49348 [Aspergillus wentii DTO 134E9]|uniref:Sigma-70 region 2 family protein n=1 Tax=Aspergillus wentii DTO 134E9 TaxID=1073089 RepID=A0A1L9RWM7_ASPWE|nr:uncharacterized protein ASPWEDRAFT_49348 [Aspergillus wentii DTO 134E9]OJJ39332.1 hypothetical protein ASPWEDRAFT_49348 [Aspergillus wentii DTO 134E9]
MSDKVESAELNAEPPQMRWQFIDASNNSRSNLTQVKRHVMQEYMRQKRQDTSQHQSDDENQPEGQTSQQKKRRRPKRTRGSKKTAPSEKSDKAGEQKNSSSLPYRSSPAPSHQFPVSPNFLYTSSNSSDFGNLPPWPPTPTPSFDITLSPKSILSAARTDPFNTYPVELDTDGQRLFDFYVNEMPACSYGTHFRSPKAHNWYTAVFVPEGMKGAVAFQNTILVHAANTWAWVRNETETKNTLIHRDRSISMLREHMMKNPKDISDVAIIGCLSAAGLEDFDPRPGHKEISWVHMRAAREMIRARGGPVAFENTRLGMLINWQDYILSGYETQGPSFSFEPNPPPSFSPRDEIQHQFDEFIEFLKRCEQLSVYQRDNSNKSTMPTRHTSFQCTALLYQILAAPPGARFTTSGDRKQIVARLVALMMLNAGLWDYRFSMVRSETFLQILEQNVIDSEVNTSGSIEALLQIMLACKDGAVNSDTNLNFFFTGIPTSPDEWQELPDFTQYSPTAQTPYGRPWFAGRMLKVAKRLSPESWARVNNFLFSCLTFQVQEPAVGMWEDELRGEVLSAPLTSYIMPALKG